MFLEPVIALSETTQTVLLIGGIILGIIVVFVLSLFFWIFALKLIFWRWWTGVLVLAAVALLFISKTITPRGIFRFFADNWTSAPVFVLALLILAAPVGLTFLFLGGGSRVNPEYQNGYCDSCGGGGWPSGCSRCGRYA
ncbi:hypothetical protein [Glutamicibacter sp. NPDC087344]|uniref:hypothetical protein n=1 Tax=Glutamicibacter sp. NPDC087344 TaxID=3363994 RepID=UPI00380E3711